MTTWSTDSPRNDLTVTVPCQRFGPDPFEQDLSPWLLRRLQLAVDIAGALHAEAGQVRRALEMGSDRV